MNERERKGLQAQRFYPSIGSINMLLFLFFCFCCYSGCGCCSENSPEIDVTSIHGHRLQRYTTPPSTVLCSVRCVHYYHKISS